MFARVVEINAKSGKIHDLSRAINDKVLSLLRNQPGFLDEMTLISDKNPDRMLALSFWKSREDAERYNREGFPKVNEIISNLIQGTPKVETFDLEQSTMYKITGGKAA